MIPISIGFILKFKKSDFDPPVAKGVTKSWPEKGVPGIEKFVTLFFSIIGTIMSVKVQKNRFQPKNPKGPNFWTVEP